MKKPRFRRFGISTGSKVQQANLRALARDMAEEPSMLIPTCAGKCPRCHFDKLLARLRKIQAYKSNPAVLKKFASGGKHLERAYAAMLILASEDTPIMFATAKLPTGDVGYTVRGSAKKEFLIGLQHFDDPKLRLLAYSELALKKRLHLYSLEDDLVCSGTDPAYPPELASEVIRSSSYSLKKCQTGFRCEHFEDGSGITVKILSAGIAIEMCRSCASRKSNIFTELTSRVLARHPEDDFRVSVEHGIRCAKEPCSISGAFGASEIMSRYKSGQLSDLALHGEYVAAVKRSVEESGRAIFILGQTCYEGDYAAFIDALGPTDIERTALTRMLKNAPGPVVMDTATPNAVLTLFWDSLGATAIYSVIGDKELARKIYAETKGSGKVPSQILRDAKIRSKSKTALAALPDFNNLSKLGKYVDDIARTYKALGKEETLKRINPAEGDTSLKSVNCGFLSALDALKGKEWQFTKEELDYGRYLADFASALFDSPPEEYADALQNLLTASGSGETVS